MFRTEMAAVLVTSIDACCGQCWCGRSAVVRPTVVRMIARELLPVVAVSANLAQFPVQVLIAVAVSRSTSADTAPTHR